jgi:hypothetical protein
MMFTSRGRADVPGLTGGVVVGADVQPRAMEAAAIATTHSNNLAASRMFGDAARREKRRAGIQGNTAAV